MPGWDSITMEEEKPTTGHALILLPPALAYLNTLRTNDKLA